MANTKNRTMGSSEDFVYTLGLKDGAIVSASWVQANLMRGKVFHAYVGNQSTPVTLDASYAATDPDISVDVPDGTAIIPLRVAVIMEAYGGTSALFETFTLVSKTLGAASAGTVFTPLNMATRSAGGSRCAVYTAPTVTSGYTVGAFELYRNVQSQAITLGTADDDSHWEHNLWEYTIAQRGYAPVIHGEGSLQTWAISSASSGYIHVEWLEFPESDLTYPS